MSDNDIIKALGYCFAVGDCEHCAYADKPCQELMGDALALINRQKAQIDILCNSLDVSSQNLENMTRAMSNIAKATRIAAIQEFAKKLKGKVYIPGAHPNYSDEIIIAIDNLVKEMTEGEDESDIKM